MQIILEHCHSYRERCLGICQFAATSHHSSRRATLIQRCQRGQRPACSRCSTRTRSCNTSASQRTCAIPCARCLAGGPTKCSSTSAHLPLLCVRCETMLIALAGLVLLRTSLKKAQSSLSHTESALQSHASAEPRPKGDDRHAGGMVCRGRRAAHWQQMCDLSPLLYIEKMLLEQCAGRNRLPQCLDGGQTRCDTALKLSAASASAQPVAQPAVHNQALVTGSEKSVDQITYSCDMERSTALTGTGSQMQWIWIMCIGRGPQAAAQSARGAKQVEIHTRSHVSFVKEGLRP